MTRKLRKQSAKAKEVVSSVERLVPLGLTTDEAKAWYRYDVLMPWVYRGVAALAVGSLFVLSLFPPFGEYFESTLTLHMVAQHLLLIVAGFLFSYAIDSLILAASRFSRMLAFGYSLLLRINSTVNRRGLFAFAAAAIITAYWHFPSNFNTAVLDESVHIEMHATFLFIGGLLFVGAKLLTRRMRHIAPIIAGKAMGLFGAFLLLTPRYVYDAYPAAQQWETGLVMVIMMIAMDVTLVPYWLYNYFGKSIPNAPIS